MIKPPHSRPWEQAAEFFQLRVVEETLVVAFRTPRCVLSWAIVNGGMRTHASHIINRHVDERTASHDPGKTLRQSARTLGIKGTFVGMMTGADVRRFFIAKAVHGEFAAYAIATAGCSNLATAGEPGAYVERRSAKVNAGTINLIVLVNFGFTAEGMIEAVAIATEAKVRAVQELELRSVATGQPATGTGTDCIAVAVGHDRRYSFCGKHTKWGELIGRASFESIRGALRSALASVTSKSGKSSRRLETTLSGK